MKLGAAEANSCIGFKASSQDEIRKECRGEIEMSLHE